MANVCYAVILHCKYKTSMKPRPMKVFDADLQNRQTGNNTLIQKQVVSAVNHFIH